MEYKNEKHKLNCERWEFVRSLTKEEYGEFGYKYNSRVGYIRGLYRCKECCCLKSIDKRNFTLRLTVCENGCHGIGNRPGFVIKGVNDMATTHPHLVKYLVNEEDANSHSYGSGKKVLMRCHECGYEKLMRINDLSHQGFGCEICSDGVSYPEKFMGNVLKHLGIKYVTQFSMARGNHKYDFYVEDYNLIIETHGIQHYEQSRRGRSLKEEQENDVAKRNRAADYGIKHYVVIDSRESEVGWMKQNIMNSDLPKLLNFKENQINWMDVERKSRTTLVKEICDYFSNSETSSYEMQQKFGINVTTIIKYLKQGSLLGWCNYNPKEQMKRSGSMAKKE